MKAVVLGLLALIVMAVPGRAGPDSAARKQSVRRFPVTSCSATPKLDHVKSPSRSTRSSQFWCWDRAPRVLPGTDGANKSYPGRLEDTLRKRFGCRDQGDCRCEIATDCG